MKIVRKFILLSWPDRCLLLEVLIHLCFVRLILTFIPFKRLAPSLRKTISVPELKNNQSTETWVRKVRWAVRVASQRLPWNPSCLVKSIAAKRILQHKDIPSTLHLGVAKNDQNLLEAHAWLQSGTIIVTGEYQLQRYSQLLTFSDRYA